MPSRECFRLTNDGQKAEARDDWCATAVSAVLSRVARLTQPWHSGHCFSDRQ
jgi:hypothetical protein